MCLLESAILPLHVRIAHLVFSNVIAMLWAFYDGDRACWTALLKNVDFSDKQIVQSTAHAVIACPVTYT